MTSSCSFSPADLVLLRLGRPPQRRVWHLPLLTLGSLLVIGCAADAPAPPPATPVQAHEPEPQVSSEPMPAEKVLYSLRGKESGARRCFALGDAPQRGLVRMSFNIDPTGTVHGAAVEHATVNEPSVGECLSQFVSDLHFDPQAANTPASWTFVYGVADPKLLVAAEKRAKAAERANNGKKGFVKPKGKRAVGRDRGPRVDRSSEGSLESSRISNVVDAGFQLYAHCFREGIGRNRYLSGRVLLHFTIDADGQVADVSDAGSDLPDLDAIDCVAQGFYALRFPAPEGGALSLTYPILLNEE